MRNKLLLRSLILTFLLAAFFSSCREDDDKPDDLVSTDSNSLVLIANQGNFGWGEGTLSIYDKETKTVRNDVYSEVNKESLGNVFQSINRVGDNYYFVINNSEKIIVTDSSFVKTAEITGLTSPRFFYLVGSNKAFVTDLYADAISVVDLNENTIVNEIDIGGSTENGVVVDGQFWCFSQDTDSIYTIDIMTEAVSFTAYIGAKPNSLSLTKEVELAVLCAGDIERNKAPSLAFFDIDELEFQLRVPLSEDSEPSHLKYSKSQNEFLYMDQGKLMSIQNNEPYQSTDVYDFNGGTMYALDIDEETGDIYAADAQDFVSRSKIYRLSNDYQLLDEFSAGIISGDFFFK